MPAGRPGNHAGSAQGARDQLRQAGQQIQETAENMGQRAREGYQSARDSAVHGYRQAEGLVARNPGQSVLVSFGLGFGVGVLLTLLLSQERESSWYERSLDRLREVPDQLRDLPERMARHLPDSLRR